MNRLSVRYALRRGAACVLSLAALAGCARMGTEANGPVTTKTDAGTTTAPPVSEAAARQGALVRFVHAVPGLAAVDLYAGDGKAFEGAAYKSTSAYRELPAASAAYRLRLAGQQAAEPLAEESKSLGTGRHQTVVAVPARSSGLLSKSATVELRFLTDEFEAPAAGRARVRVVNASPDLDELDLYAAGHAEPLVKGAKFGAATAYADAEPAGAGLEVRRAGENIATLSVPGARVEAGRLYTVFVVGGTKGASGLEAFVVEDRLGAPPAR
ncbi:MAG TPA: DUF4397 domain-containing protein [Pyrinomonadaceae bacterium]|jgi:hypothetical protein